MMMKRMMIALALVASSAVGMQAQDAAADAVAKGTVISPAATFEPMLANVEKEFVSAAKAMPADKYSFAPSAAIFVPAQTNDYKGVSTFAREVGHTAQANYFYFGTLSGIKPDVDVKAIGMLTSKDDLVKALEGSFVFAHKAIAAMTAADAFKTVRGTQTPVSLASGGIAHAFDHYGHVTEYLRMNGIIPPSSVK